MVQHKRSRIVRRNTPSVFVCDESSLPSCGSQSFFVPWSGTETLTATPQSHSLHPPSAAVVLCAPQRFEGRAQIKQKTRSFDLVWCERRDTSLLRKYCILVDPMLCIRYPTSDFEAKNSPQDCFLNASHPLRLQVPLCFYIN